MIKRLLVTFISLLFGVAMVAATYNADNIKIEYLSDSTHYVSDPDGILNPDSVAEINRMLRRLEDSTSIQTAVIVVENVEYGDCYEFAMNVGNKFGVGHSGVDNGLVIVLATKDRCIQFCTGRGLEGDLPDVICKRIQYKYMNDHFSNEEWDAGLTGGVRVVSKYLEGTERPDLSTGDSFDTGILLFMLLFFLLPILSWIRGKRCPKCHKYFRLSKISTSLYDKNRYNETYKDVFRCSHCNEKITRYRSVSFSNGGGYIGGYGRGGGFGGGFKGGSFGGGGFGGGGAGSRF